MDNSPYSITLILEGSVTSTAGGNVGMKTIATDQFALEYRIAGKFGGRTVWRIWQIIHGSPTIQISNYN